MLTKKEVTLSGVGDMCSRSRSASLNQSDINEFETEILEAIAMAEIKSTENVLKLEEQ